MNKPYNIQNTNICNGISVETDSEKADDNTSAERPVRNHRTPAKFNDFVMYWFNWQSLIITSAQVTFFLMNYASNAKIV
jgi:hypothetical protein